MEKRELVYWVGADHHKRNTYVTSRDPDGAILLRKNLPAKVESLTEFFRNHPKPFVVGIEATYAWEYVADIVEGMGQEVRVGHPAFLKAFARKHKKNDKIDSGLISDLLWRGEIFPSSPTRPKRRAKNATSIASAWNSSSDAAAHRPAPNPSPTDSASRPP